jgi:hypothetical protein
MRSVRIPSSEESRGVIPYTMLRLPGMVIDSGTVPTKLLLDKSLFVKSKKKKETKKKKNRNCEPHFISALHDLKIAQRQRTGWRGLANWRKRRESLRKSCSRSCKDTAAL